MNSHKKCRVGWQKHRNKQIVLSVIEKDILG